MPKLDNPLNVLHGKGEDRIKREGVTYYCIANGMYYGKKGDGDIAIDKGTWRKLTAAQAGGLSECIVDEKTAKQFQVDKSSKSLTTKSLAGDIGTKD